MLSFNHILFFSIHEINIVYNQKEMEANALIINLILNT